MPQARSIDYAPPHKSDGPSWLPYGWQYLAPMALFLACIQVGATWKPLAPWMYVARTFSVGVLLWLLWRAYTKVVWSNLGLAVAVGVVGVVQWVGMEKGLVWL